MKIREGFVSNSSSSSFILAHLPEEPWTREEKETYLKDLGLSYCEDGMYRGSKYTDKEQLLLTNEELDKIMNTDCVLKLMDGEWIDPEELSRYKSVVMSKTFMEY